MNKYKKILIGNILIISKLFSCENMIDNNEIFPKNFSNECLYQLIDKTEIRDGFKVFTISQEDKAKLYSYSPGSHQIITKNSFSNRVTKTSEDTLNFTARYTLAGAYYGQDTIELKAQYNIFKLFLKDEKISENGWSLYKIFMTDDGVNNQTNCKKRLNNAAANLCFILKNLDLNIAEKLTPKERTTLGLTSYLERLKNEKVGQSILENVQLDKEADLDPAIFSKIYNEIKRDIYKKISVNPELLKKQFEVGMMAIEEERLRAIEEEKTKEDENPIIYVNENLQ